MAGKPRSARGGDAVVDPEGGGGVVIVEAVAGVIIAKGAARPSATFVTQSHTRQDSLVRPPRKTMSAVFHALKHFALTNLMGRLYRPLRRVSSGFARFFLRVTRLATQFHAPP